MLTCITLVIRIKFLLAVAVIVFCAGKRPKFSGENSAGFMYLKITLKARVFYSVHSFCHTP